LKVLLINGSPNEEGCTYTALEEIIKEFNKEGIEHELIQIGKKAIKGCAACFACSKLKNGHCVFDDDLVNEVIDKIMESDAVIVGSPVYYAGVSGQVKALLDRVFFAGSGFKNKLAASVVSCRRGGASAAFDQMNHYFTMNSMHIVSSQYWNQVHGFTPDDVKQDLEGLQTMRTLGKNMAWLLKCIDLANKNNIPKPVYEEWMPTHFIR
jgi:Multimeric flavodoxin WrbA